MVPLHAPQFKRLRRSALLLGVSNALIIIMGIVIVFVVVVVAGGDSCKDKGVAPVIVAMMVSVIRISAMIATGIAQQHAASSILTTYTDLPDSQAAIRQQRRKKYRKLLLWTRIASVITMLQLLGAVFLLVSVTNLFHSDTTSSNCLRGILSNGSKWQRTMLILFMVIISYVGPVQCFAGADVLRWRSFYATEDNAWRAHYREVFDHGIREALCCLGRVKYLTVLEEDEVCSVAQLLGDLVTYRASGTGLALLQNPCSFSKSYEESVVVPMERIREAAFYHPFAEAAYTGLLLDIGRNPVLFSCSWLYRQGILAPWLWNRRPLLEGDNWWRGHAAAFLKHVHLSAHMLRKGRVNQGKCKAAYFIVVLHNVKSVVIAVRGTETPEDLITDGLGRECCLTEEELDSLLSGDYFDPCIRQRVVSSSPHYAHSGVVEAARDLYMQVDGNGGDGPQKLLWTGFSGVCLYGTLWLEGVFVLIPLEAKANRVIRNGQRWMIDLFIRIASGTSEEMGVIERFTVCRTVGGLEKMKAGTKFKLGFPLAKTIGLEKRCYNGLMSNHMHFFCLQNRGMAHNGPDCNIAGTGGMPIEAGTTSKHLQSVA
ncbi:putative V-type proton ATPase subunit e-like [Capsicum annuum]|nr:putative V-type proton ATPase subunit e-like [Capsicum annuum]